MKNIIDYTKNHRKLSIVIGAVVLILLIAVALQKFTTLDPFTRAKYYLSGDYKARYYKPSGQTSIPEKTVSGPDAEKNLNIFIRQFAFVPNSNAIKTGTQVTWKNEDTVTHNVAGDGWASPDLLPGATFSKTFDQPGTYKYHCSIHPSMTGELIVQ